MSVRSVSLSLGSGQSLRAELLSGERRIPAHLLATRQTGVHVAVQTRPHAAPQQGARGAAGGLLNAMCRLAAVVAFAAVASQAQQTPAGTSAEPLKVNPLAALRAFEPDANEEYTLGRGDEISIEVNGRPELSRKYTIGPDGRITLPLAGPVSLVDKTREQASKIVEAAYGTYYSAVSVTVGVDKYTSNHVLLLGAVEHPGLMSFDRTPTLLEVISRGGIGGGLGSINAMAIAGEPGKAGRYIAGGMPPAIPERCAIYRGADEAMWVDLRALLQGGNSLADLRLKRDDVVYVPSASDRYVSVLGQVLHPGAIQLDNNTTLQKLLAEAGGVTELAGTNPRVEIISSATGKKRTVTLNALLTPATLDLSLHSGDIVYVAESGFNKATYLLQRLSPLVSLFASAAFFGQ